MSRSAHPVPRFSFHTETWGRHAASFEMPCHEDNYDDDRFDFDEQSDPEIGNGVVPISRESSPFDELIQREEPERLFA